MDRAVLVYLVDGTVTEQRFKGHRITAQIWPDGRVHIRVYREDFSVDTFFLAVSACSCSIQSNK
jgi:hypothetical protein